MGEMGMDISEGMFEQEFDFVFIDGLLRFENQFTVFCFQIESVSWLWD